jgi:hypothetical protein
VKETTHKDCILRDSVNEISRIGKFIEDYKDMEVSGCSVSFRGHVNILETDSGN